MQNYYGNSILETPTKQLKNRGETDGQTFINRWMIERAKLGEATWSPAFDEEENKNSPDRNRGFAMNGR